MKALAACTLVAGVSLAAFAIPGRGGSTGASGNVTVTLVAEPAAVQPGRPFHVGVRMKMRDGWHTYWKNPGDAGLPLQIVWRLPEGSRAGPIEWPVPERMPAGPVMSYGYEREVLLPIEITPPDRIEGDSMTIEGVLDWLECKDVCLPGSAVLDLRLPVRSGPPSPGPAAALFVEARSRMPRAPDGWSLSAEAGPRAISLAARAPSGFSAQGGYLFLDQPLVADFGIPQGFERTKDGYRLTMTPAPNAPRPPARLTGVLVFDEPAGAGGPAALQIDVPVTQGDPAPAPGQSERAGLPKAAYAAIIGLFALGVALLLRIAARGRTAGDQDRNP